MKNRITYKRANKLLNYNPKTGIITWKETRSPKVVSGDTAGYKCYRGYIRIVIDYNIYLAHRLAWLLYYKKWPKYDIDHKDRIKHHNWKSNLRKSSKKHNARNTGNLKNNTSGIKGVSLHKKAEKWMSYIKVDRNRIYLGLFEDFDDAVLARYEKENELGWHKADKMSPAYKYCLENGLIPILVRIKKKGRKQ